MGKTHRFAAEQFIPAPIDKVWDFMSSPNNLRHITPVSMQMEVLNNSADGAMYPGMIITYRVSPFALLRLGWVTEITHVEKLKYFVDEQRFGPFAFWHHKHFLEEKDAGVLMRDIVDYRLPMGWMGNLLGAATVRKKLKEIFEFRKAALENIFPSPK